jgi:Domain of unknown function (DUF4202)
MHSTLLQASVRCRRVARRASVVSYAVAAASEDGRLARVLSAIDALNAADQRRVEVAGEQQPYELAYSRWLSGWVDALATNPSEELRIVARGQHVERWRTPRSAYPEVRHRWAHHASCSCLQAATPLPPAPVKHQMPR